jgi:ribosomal protein S10
MTRLRRPSMRSRSHDDWITAIEGRVGEIETNHGKTLYELKQFKTKTGLQMNKMMKHFDIEPVTEHEVDEVLDAE